MGHVHCSDNNCILSVADEQGNVLMWSSGGKLKLRGTARATAVAGQQLSSTLGTVCVNRGAKSIALKFKGPGRIRRGIVAGFLKAGLSITSLEDVTPIPFNGCKLPHRRRL